MDWITLKKDEVENDRMPPVCVHCGAAATGRHNQTRSWHPRWVQHLYWLAVLPGAIAQAILTREMRLSLPVCDAHHPDKPPPTEPFKFTRKGLTLLLLLIALPLTGMAAAWLLTMPWGVWDRARFERELSATNEKIKGVQTKAEFENLVAQRIYLSDRLRYGPFDASRQHWWANTLPFALPIGGIAGFGVWILAALTLALLWPGARQPAPKKPKPILVQEITADGISLQGVDAAFVQAVIAQRQPPAPG